MRSFFALIFLVMIGSFIYYYSVRLNSNMSETSSNPTNPIVIVRTTSGDIEIELYKDKAPITSANFLGLAERGFYNDLLFHRVIAGFMIQGGDPNTRAGDPRTFGTGGPGYAIDDEFGEGLSNVSGTLSMANAGPNTGGSQFFINVADNTFLDGKHAVFGKVIVGMDKVIKMSKALTNENDLPLSPIRIDEVVVKQ